MDTELIQHKPDDLEGETLRDESRAKDWHVFISHASEDKEKVARPLAALLTKAGFRVWLDEAELTLGDSLRRKIDAGLAHSKYGIVILSEVFFAKEWPQRELDALVAREDDGRKVILPIWHEVNKTIIARFSPLLADRLSVSTDKGLDYVAAAVVKVLSGADPVQQRDVRKIYGLTYAKLQAIGKGRFATILVGLVGLISLVVAVMVWFNGHEVADAIADSSFNRKENMEKRLTEELKKAVDSGNIQAIDRAIAKGDDINGQDSLGQHPLLFASINCDPEVVNWLLLHNAKTDLFFRCDTDNYQDGRYKGWTPLYAAQQQLKYAPSEMKTQQCQAVVTKLKSVKAPGRHVCP